ncbi:hypothetical protein P154DRAFT_277203 [Amniculicola lignicola CBS 123094]|uniref:Uncharacterized protein n=1 Tax=Amniculicola lignicola CBS 123094 TaxID=1392246 RepID=A0A6A5WA42_9PLEO|nr:hypothetical protein P154DRAFT_277203 [Amniculicola lignicola CBS 123094]
MILSEWCRACNCQDKVSQSGYFGMRTRRSPARRGTIQGTQQLAQDQNIYLCLFCVLVVAPFTQVAGYTGGVGSIIDHHFLYPIHEPYSMRAH